MVLKQFFEDESIKSSAQNVPHQKIKTDNNILNQMIRNTTTNKYKNTSPTTPLPSLYISVGFKKKKRVSPPRVCWGDLYICLGFIYIYVVSYADVIYHLVMTNSSPWKITMLLIGKPSISMGHLYHGELLVITEGMCNYDISVCRWVAVFFL